MPPQPKDPSTRQRRNKASTNAVLKLATDHDVPALPPAADWLPAFDDEVGAPPEQAEWPNPVKAWWNDIWSSPMSNEFVHSDVHGLFQAAFYLAQMVNPGLKMTDRLSAGRQYEAAVKNYGLTPMSRRALQWEIERVTDAQARGAKRRGRPAKMPADAYTPDPRAYRQADEENPYAAESG